MCGAYIPPNYPPEKYSAFCDAFEEAFTEHLPHKDAVIAGDFSLPNVDWSNKKGQVFDLITQYLLDLSNKMNLNQLNTAVNERGVTLDLVLTSIRNTSVKPAVDIMLQQNRHHPALEIDFEVSSSSDSRSESWKRDLKNCNLDNVLSWIQNTPFLLPDENIEHVFVNFCQRLEGVVVKSCPLKFVGNSNFPR